jgi:hypothetical protein
MVPCAALEPRLPKFSGDENGQLSQVGRQPTWNRRTHTTRVANKVVAHTALTRMARGMRFATVLTAR